MDDEVEVVAAEPEVVEADKPKRGRPAKADVQMIRVKILRDTWSDDAKALAIGQGRIPAGTEVDLPVETAMDGVEAGVYSRVRD